MTNYLVMMIDIHKEKELVKYQVSQIPRIQKAVDNLADEFPYAWFICVDFDLESDPVDPNTALKRTFGWLRHMARIYSVHFAPFVSSEPLYTLKRMSVHLILRCDQKLSMREIAMFWKHGKTYIKKYNPHLEGVKYIFDHHVAPQSTHVVCSGKKPCRVNRKGRVFCTHKVNRVLEL